MADLKLVGAVAIKVRPDTSGFKEKTQTGVAKELRGVEATIPAELELDTAAAKIEAKKVEKELSGKKITWKIKLDHDSVRAAQQQFDRMLEPTKKISFDLKDKGSIRKAEAKLARLAEKAKVHMTMTQDEKGYREVLAKIDAVRRQKLEIPIKIGTSDAELDRWEADMKAKLRRFDPVVEVAVKQKLTIDVQADEGVLKSELAKVEAEIAKHRVQNIEFDTDIRSLLQARERVLAEMQKLPISFKFSNDIEGYTALAAKIKEIQKDRQINMFIDLNLNDDELAAEALKVRQKLSDLDRPRTILIELDHQGKAKVEQEIKEMKRRLDGLSSTIDVQLQGTAFVSAQLAFLGRNRIVTYFAHVNARSIAVAEGTLKSLAGLNVLHEATNLLERLFTRFDTFALKLSALAVALGNVANVALFATSSVVAVADGVFASLGLLALLPTIVGTAFSTLVILQAVFKDFGAAAHGIQKALERLPPSGQKAAKMFQTVFAEMRENISKEFWDRASDAMLRFAERTLPAFSKGLAGVAGEMGGVFAGILDSFTNLQATGGIEAMFNNLIGMFQNMAVGATAFWDALNLVGLRGSEFLPQFGTWLSEISIQFKNWITEADKAGRINQWIRDGVESLHSMWRVGGDVIDIFKALARAAETAGTGGLGVFEKNLRATADRMNGEPWQSRAAKIFEGARAGAHNLNIGFKDLKSTIGDSSAVFANFLAVLGAIGGGLLTDLGVVLGNTNYQTGVTAALDGLLTLMTELQPAAEHLGNIFGDLGKIAGVAFTGLGPVITQMVGLVDQAFSKISGSLEQITPRLMNTVGALFEAATPAVLALADVLDSVLQVINLLPGGFVAASVAAVVFFALRAVASKFFESLSGTQYFQRLQSNFVQSAVAAGRLHNEMRLVNGTLQQVAIPNDKFRLTGAIFRDLTSNVTNTTGALRSMYQLASSSTQLGPLGAGMATTRNALQNVGTAAREAGTHLGSTYGILRSGLTSMGPMAAGLATARTAFTHVGTEARTTAGHLGSMYGMFRTAPGSVGPLHAAMTTARTAIGATAGAISGGAGRGLLNLLGGPWGIAFLGAAAVVGIWSQKTRDAKAAGDALAGTLDKLTGAITDQTAAMITANLVNDTNAGFYLMESGAKSATEALGKLGLKTQDVGGIIARGGEDYDTLIANLEAGQDAVIKATDVWKDNGEIVKGNKDDLDEWMKSMHLARGAGAPILDQQDFTHILDVLKKQKAIVDAQQSKIFQQNDSVISASEQRVKSFDEAMRRYNDSALTADARTRAFKDALDLLNGKELDLEDATKSVNDALRSATGTWQQFSEEVNGEIVTTMKLVGGAFRDSAGNVKDFTGVIDSTTGVINTVGEAGAGLYESLKTTVGGVRAVTTEMKDQKKPAEEIIAYLDQQRTNFIKLGTEAGLNGDLVALAYDHMMQANPEELKTLITAEGIEDAETKLRTYKGTLDEIDAYRAVAELAADDKVLGVKLADSYHSLEEWDKAVGTATADLDPAKADAVRERLLMDLVNLAATNPTVAANIDPQLFDRALQIINGDIDNLRKQRPSPVVDAQIWEAQQKLQAIQAMIDNLRGTTVAIGVHTSYTSSGEALPPGYVARNGIPVATGANGAILNRFAKGMHGFNPGMKFFANGGIEKHVAQIQRAGGPVRVWAEPETKAEAYIPYALAKRPRSTAILSQVAKDFGYTLTKATQEFANGGITLGSSGNNRTTSADVHIGSIHTVDMNEAVAKLRQSQRDALAVAGISNIGG